MAKPQKRRGVLRIRTERDGYSRDSIVLDQNVRQHVWLVNITREQVQTRGGGGSERFGTHELLLSPGVIDNPGTPAKGYRDGRNCMWFVKERVAVKMARKRKASLRLLPRQQGNELMRRAKEYAPQYGREAFFKALGEMFPKWVLHNEVDEARVKRELLRLRAQYKQSFGETPEDDWSAERLQRAIKNQMSGYTENVGDDGKDDIFDLYGKPAAAFLPVPEDDMVGDPDEPGDNEVEDEDATAAAVAAMTPEQRAEYLRLEGLTHSLVQSVQVPAADPRAARMAEIREILAKRGVKTWPAQKLETLEKLLAKSVAEQTQMAGSSA